MIALTEEQKKRIASIVHTDCTLIPGATFYNAAELAIEATLAASPAAPAQPEPVAWLYEHAEQDARYTTLRSPEESRAIADAGWIVTPLYAAPPAQTAVTDEVRRFLDAAAGEGLVLDGIDAGDLFLKIFPNHYDGHPIPGAKS